MQLSWKITKIIEKFYRNTKNHQKDSIQQLMGADTESHNHTLGTAWGVLEGSRSVYQRNQRGQGHWKNTAQRIKWLGLKWTRDLWRPNLGPLHKCYRWEAWEQQRELGPSLTLLPACRTLFLLLGCLTHPWCNGIHLVFVTCCVVCFMSLGGLFFIEGRENGMGWGAGEQER